MAYTPMLCTFCDLTADDDESILFQGLAGCSKHAKQARLHVYKIRNLNFMRTNFAAIRYQITPEEFCHAQNFGRFRLRDRWLVFDVCPFCGGGDARDARTFVVHSISGVYSCQRAKCGAVGSFWQLIESQHLNPREFLEKEQASAKAAAGSRKPRKKNYLYGGARTA